MDNREDPDEDLIVWDELPPEQAAELGRLADRFIVAVEGLERMIEREEEQTAQLNALANLPAIASNQRRPRMPR